MSGKEFFYFMFSLKRTKCIALGSKSLESCSRSSCSHEEVECKYPKVVILFRFIFVSCCGVFLGLAWDMLGNFRYAIRFLDASGAFFED